MAAELEAAARQLTSLGNRWDDAVSLASRTARIALPPQIQALQALRREAQGITVPTCLARAKSYLVTMMDAQISAFLAFLGQESERKQAAYLAQAKQAQQSVVGAAGDCTEALR